MPPATELFEASLGSLFLAVSAVSMGLATLRLPAGDRSPIWFGLFVGLYGVRLSIDSVLVQQLLPGPPATWRYVDAFVTYSIVAPGGLFAESLLGRGWRGLLRRTWQILAVYASAAIVVDLARGEPGSMLWLNGPAVVVGGGVVIVHAIARSRREALSRGVRVATAGGLIFAAVAFTETVRGRGVLGPGVDLEPFAMVVFVATLGYALATRVMITERRLVAVSRELELAREIQQSILPHEMPALEGLRVAARYLPMGAVAGDFYDFARYEDGRLAVLVADVSGHGVPAALIASMVKVAFETGTKRIDDPGAVLSSINGVLCGKFERAYVTACCAVVDPARGELRYANAGHPSMALLRVSGGAQMLDQREMALSFDPAARYGTAAVPFRPGDVALLYSDGLLEAEDAHGEFFGDRRLPQLLAASADASPDRVVDGLLAELHRWRGPERALQDDVTVVAVAAVGHGQAA